MAAIHLASAVGGDVFLGFISAVAFATILAVVAGLTLSGASAVSHDLYATVFKKNAADSKSELKVSRVTTLVLGVVAVILGIAFEKQNVAFMVSLAFALAASGNFPVLILSLLWKGCTTRGAVIGGFLGVITALVLWSRAPVLHGPHGPMAQRGCYSDVVETFLAENATSPEAATRLLTAANFLILSGRRESARKALHRLLSEHPNNLDALRNYAWLLTREGWHEEALSIWRRVLGELPNDDVSRYFALTCLSRQSSEGKRQAIAELDKVLSVRPDFYLGRLLLGKLLDPDGEALEHFETLCRQLPTFYAVWYYQGQSLYHRREYQAALPCLEKAIALNGQFAPARQLLSHTHLQLGNLPASHVEQGNFYFLTKKYHLARFSYEEALELDPNTEDAHKGIRLVERRLQRLECPTPNELYSIISPRYRVS